MAVIGALFFLNIAATRADELKVTLLGTGTPKPIVGSFSASTLVEAGSEKLLFDVGRGSTIRLFLKNIALGAITATFLTHLHSDHIVGLPDLWLTGWLGTPWASRKVPFLLYGPAGTVAMTKNLTAAFSEDIRIREDDEHLPVKAIEFEAHDIVAGLVYAHGGVTVTAIEVNHGEKIKPAYGYVIEYDGKKVVLSGDTKYDERIAEAARGADLLIHEVAVIDPLLVKDYRSYQDIANHHSSPEDAGRIFTLAKPALAAYSHIVFATVKPQQDVPEDVLLERTRFAYRGPLVIGRDLTSFVISDQVLVFNAAGEAVIPFGDALP